MKGANKAAGTKLLKGQTALWINNTNGTGDVITRSSDHLRMSQRWPFAVAVLGELSWALTGATS